MVKKNIKNQFKKGNTKSVGFGRPALTEKEKELSLRTRTQFKNILNKYMLLNVSELKKLLKRKTIPALDLMVLQAIKNTIDSGETQKIDWCLDHVLGKTKDETHISLRGTVDNTNSIDLKKLSKEELLALKVISEKAK